jgi:hypothetical protein
VIRGISAAISQPFSQVLAALAVAMRTLKPGVAYRVLQLSARSLVVGLGILVSASGTAAGDSKAVVSTQHVTATLVAEVAAVVPGATHWLGLQLRLAPQWHVYWRNPGDSGYPPSFTWTLPAGARAGEIEWPLPTRIAVGPLTNFGYKGEVLLAVPIEIPEDYAARSFPVRLAAEWLVCKEDCIPESEPSPWSCPSSVHSHKRSPGSAACLPPPGRQCRCRRHRPAGRSRRVSRAARSAFGSSPQPPRRRSIRSPSSLSPRDRCSLRPSSGCGGSPRAMS